MGELLLELLSEEIPARMQRRAIDDLTALVRDKLAAAEIPAATLTGYVTPRRLTVIADGIPARQPDRSEERRGPRVSSPQPAIDGFLRGAGLSSIDQCEVRGTDRGEFYFAIIRQSGQPTAEVLPALIHAAMSELPWPKSMRYPASNLRWVRPLNTVICLFDGVVVNLPLGEVPVGRVTQGHRFLSKGEISVANAADYLAKLEKDHVVLDRNKRRQIIADGLKTQAKAEGLTVKQDDALLDEVTGLVEYPVVLIGSIDADFVRPLPEGLPPEVLATAMRTHQKYFSCLNPAGTPAPRFLFVANNVTPDQGKTIAAGNERVLRARLSDARFFWDQDRKIPLGDRVEALKQRIYHEKLGSVYDKVHWMEGLIDFLQERVPGSLYHHSHRAVLLAKADLSTGLVGEFPELQGVIGRYYALYGPNEPEDVRVADAIADHYKPAGRGDNCPTAPTSVVVALADKLVTLYAFFSIDEEPSGSRDPYALRRAAQGVIRLILENRLRIPLSAGFERVHTARGKAHEWMKDPTLFILDRLKVHLRERGVRHDFIDAVRFPPGEAVEEDLMRLMARVEALEAFLDTDDGANILVAYRRASNIVAIEERKDSRTYDLGIVANHLDLTEEKSLALNLEQVDGLARELLQQEKFEEAMAALARLRQPIDEFFEKVTVNSDDTKLRENRLRLLARIRATMNQVADFSQIEG
jgi:glycyl-tRNA synthetase beta chain